MNELYSRTAMLLSEEGIDKLKSSTVAVFGCGGVGSYIIEALTRAGVGHIIIIDGDKIAPSNLNRQLIATVDTIGMDKTEATRQRILSINPSAEVSAYNLFYTAENADTVSFDGVDYIADAIDTVTSKLIIIERAKAMGIPVISSMGTGNKLDPTRFRISDINKTSVCPLARVMRKLLREHGVDSLKVLWSDEEAMTPIAEYDMSSNETHGKRQTPGSVSFVPSVAGLIIAGEIIRDLCRIKLK